jgi:hypothetical protein
MQDGNPHELRFVGIFATRHLNPSSAPATNKSKTVARLLGNATV